MRNILIAEDNIDISDMMANYLKREGLNVIQAYDGEQALKFIGVVDLILLDIMMPKMDGYEVCKRIRKELNVPIIVVSAKVTDDDKEKMFNLGADDYMVKPFSFKEMVLRVNAQLRRYYELNSSNKSSVKKYGNLVISSNDYEVKVDDTILSLTNKEFKILDYLTSHENKIIPKQKLIDDVWGIDEYIDENTLAVTIKRLREKLENYGINNVVTIWGLGYKWQY